MKLIRRIRSTWNPDMYHGWGRQRRYFEGWYFKLVDDGQQNALAIIPGISMPQTGEPHAFIQIMDGIAGKAYYHRFAADEFRPSPTRFELNLGDNFFSATHIKLNLPGLSGNLRFLNPSPWPKMLGAPGIMGWYSFVPFMECFHGVVSLHHNLEGELRTEQGAISFDGGKGYTEKDWGRSFPRAYVWMQGNHFDSADRASLMASVAHIPWLGSYFIGFIGGFWLDGRLFRFATYTGAKKRLEIDREQLLLVFKNAATELRVQAYQAPGTSLHSPVSGEMTGKVNESLRATVRAELLENGRRIFEGTTHTAGLEVAGDTGILLK